MKRLATILTWLVSIAAIAQTQIPPMAPDSPLAVIGNPYSSQWLRQATNPALGLSFLGGITGDLSVATNLPISSVVPGIMQANIGLNGVLTATFLQVQKSNLQVDNAGNVAVAGNLTNTGTVYGNDFVGKIGGTNISGTISNNTTGNAATSTTATTATNLVGSVSLAQLPASVITNGVNYQSFLTYSTFGLNPGAQTASNVWLYFGLTATNLTLTSSNALFVDTNGYAVRDPAQFKWTDNNGNVYFLLTYGAYYFNNNANSNIVGVAQSLDFGKTYKSLGYINFSNAWAHQWSAKLATDSTNGLLMTVAFGPTVGGSPTNNFICKINTTNFLSYSGLRVLGTYGLGTPEQSSGILLYNSGLYYYFDSSGDLDTNSTLGPTGWGWAFNDNSFSWSFGNAGPSVVQFNGLWYWFVSDNVLTFITSTNLQDWRGSSGGKVFFPPYDGPYTALSYFQEGTAIVGNYAIQPPSSSAFLLATGLSPLDGSGLTNLNASSISSGTLVAARLPYPAQGAAAALTNLSNGNGSALSSLNAANMSSGNTSTSNQWVGRFTGDMEDGTNRQSFASIGPATVVASNMVPQIIAATTYIVTNGVNGATISNNAPSVLAVLTSTNTYDGMYIRNYSSGTNASGEVGVMADNGTLTNNITLLGMNSSLMTNFAIPPGGQLLAYLGVFGNYTNYADTAAKTPDFAFFTAQTNSKVWWSIGNGLTRSNMWLDDAGLHVVGTNSFIGNGSGLSALPSYVLTNGFPGPLIISNANISAMIWLSSTDATFQVANGVLTNNIIVNTNGLVTIGATNQFGTGGVTISNRVVDVGSSSISKFVMGDVNISRNGASTLQIGSTTANNASGALVCQAITGSLIKGTGFSSVNTGFHIPVAVSVGASPFSFTNNTTSALECYFSGATAFSVSKNGTGVYGSLAGDSYFVLQPTNNCTITYTVAPTFNTNTW